MPDLNNVKLFQGIPPRALKALSRSLKEVQHPAGKEIMATGQNGIGFMVILEGEAEVALPQGHKHKLGPGDSFGEMALLDHRGRSATVTALTDMKLAAVAEWEFKSFLAENPEVAYRLLQVMASRLRDAQAAPG
ncbi:MAG: cyclic nucleotide-binding domain-containing protein [Candidatus Dormibacteria bacterium]